MGKFPAFQFYAGDWRADGVVSLMSLEEEGAYIRLLAYAWLEGSIPIDPGHRARILKVTRRKADRLWENSLSQLWEPNEDADGLVNPRQHQQKKRYEQLRVKRQLAGQKSAEVKAAAAEQDGNKC